MKGVGRRLTFQPRIGGGDGGGHGLWVRRDPSPLTNQWGKVFLQLVLSFLKSPLRVPGFAGGGGF